MRELLRAKARAKMRKKGIVHMNKPRYGVRSGMVMKLPSYFADHWREFAGE